MSENPKFGIIDYSISEFTFKRPPGDMQNHPIVISFIPSGRYKSKDGTFYLKLIFSCVFENKVDELTKGVLDAEFRFQEPIPFESIPKYFYVNSVAILFPFVRSFVSTLTLQANSGLVLLPILNLSNLEETLRNSTVEIAD